MSYTNESEFGAGNRQAWVDQPMQTERELEIPMLLARLEKAQAEVDLRVDDLHSRISPILADSVAKEGKLNPPMAAITPLGDRLLRALNGLTAVSTRLTDLAQRVQL
jgi:hypothetical protein